MAFPANSDFLGGISLGNATPADQWEEYLAMYIVEDILPCGRFEKKECPDLHGGGVGIEVVRARPKTYEERRSYIRHILSAKQNGNGQACLPLKRYGRAAIRTADSHRVDKALLLAAVRKKEAKLNRGHYKLFGRQGLFIFSLISSLGEAPHGEDLKWALYEEIQAVMGAYERRFDFILVYSEPRGEVYWFSFSEGAIRTAKVDRAKYDPRLALLSGIVN